LEPLTSSQVASDGASPALASPSAQNAISKTAYEALSFLESLLAGTWEDTNAAQVERQPENEPQFNNFKQASESVATSERGSRAAEPGCSESTSRIVVGADRLKAQAEALRKRRLNHGSAGLNPSAGTAQHVDCMPAQSKSAPSSKQEDESTRAMRQQEQEAAHRRRLEEIQAAAAQEQERLLSALQHDRDELEASRRKQDEWQEKVRLEADQRLREAEQEAAWQEEQRRQENAEWRRRWWQDWRRAEAKAAEKTEEQKRWSANWRSQFRADPNEEDFTSSDGAGHPQDETADVFAGIPPPRAAVKAATSNPLLADVLLELRTQRAGTLHVRRQDWRQLCLRWHPDKCAKEDAKEVFQFLQSLKDWFLSD
jgi:hypothetical protein